MKLVLFAAIFIFASVTGCFAQPPTPQQVKAISGSDPVFPEEAKNEIYGTAVMMSLEVDKKGKVTRVRAFGPLTPCANLRDPIVESIRKAAIDAAKGTVFDPILENGKPIDATLSISYLLRPRSVTEESKKVVSGGVLNGKVLSLPRPEYPSAARASRAGGAVAVQVLVGENGHVLSAAAISGHPLLLESGAEAACAARFAPVTLNGQPVKVSGVVTYNFVP